jgi:hypothetical protein
VAWNDFTNCCAANNQAVVAEIEKIGESAVRSFISMWRALPLDVRSYVVAAAGFGATYLSVALAAAGVEGAEVIAAFLFGFGVAWAIDMLMNCSGQL